MAVTINSGPIEAEYLLRHVPEEKWRELMLARRRFLEIKLSYDCRCLVQFVNDAKLMFEALGFSSVEHMIRDGYGLRPEEISIAIDWLKLNPPVDPIGIDEAIKLGKRGRPRKGEGKGGITTFSSSQRNTKPHILARLDRDGHAGLAAKVRAKQMSANKAAEEAGYRKKLSALDQILKLLPKLTTAERRDLQAALLELAA